MPRGGDAPRRLAWRRPRLGRAVRLLDRARAVRQHDRVRVDPHLHRALDGRLAHHHQETAACPREEAARCVREAVPRDESAQLLGLGRVLLPRWSPDVAEIAEMQLLELGGRVLAAIRVGRVRQHRLPRRHRVGERLAELGGVHGEDRLPRLLGGLGEGTHHPHLLGERHGGVLEVVHLLAVVSGRAGGEGDVDDVHHPLEPRKDGRLPRIGRVAQRDHRVGPVAAASVAQLVDAREQEATVVLAARPVEPLLGCRRVEVLGAPQELRCSPGPEVLWHAAVPQLGRPLA
mmetsp:Transcript_33769/g.112699  ORF Transcript_33769/g.112699 Transcript_33769/m.112699 type:complete len:289 (+) Transcript_33769:284-1150(+)